MKQRLFQFSTVLLVAMSLASCSGLPKTSGGGGGGNATLSLTMIDVPPANSSILSFKTTITGIALNPATGSAVTLISSSNSLAVELTRLQSDSAFLGTFTTVPAGTYDSMTVTLANPDIVLSNQTGAALTGATAACPNNSVCEFKPTPMGGAPQITFASPLSLTSTSPQGLSLDFNFNNAITSTGGTLGVDFSQTNQPKFLTVTTLPRTNSNLSTGQLDLIEDFTGVVSLSGTNITITSPTRGAITATTNSNTIFDHDPSNSLCGTPSPSCVVANQVASADVLVNSNGTFSFQEFEPLLSTPQDIVEGTVVSISQSNLTQFEMVTTDKLSTATPTSLISSLKVGDALTVNIPSPNPFLIDTKGLAVPSSNLSNFAGATNTSVLRLGQTVAIHAAAFTAASGTTIASAIADTVTLRWSRFTATATAPFSPTTFNVSGLPSFFNLTSSSQFEAQTFSGAPGSINGTNLDGVTTVANLTAGNPVASRALYIQNSTNSSQFVFFAAKVRQH